MVEPPLGPRLPRGGKQNAWRRAVGIACPDFIAKGFREGPTLRSTAGRVWRRVAARDMDPAQLIRFLEEQPPWLLALGGAVLLAIVLWILARLLKWGLTLLAFLVLVAGVAAAVWLLFN